MFRISTVLPDRLVTISPGFVAPPLGMFSEAATKPTTLTGIFRLAMALITPSTAAEPHMSNFISSIAGLGLMLMPPVSKVTPFPTKQTGLVSSSAPR